MKQTIKPPAHLSDTMQSFWRKLTHDYAFSAEHLHILRVGCEQFDRCQAAREQIKADGMILNGKRHPLLGIEAKAMELFLRAVRDLGMEEEANNAAK